MTEELAAIVERMQGWTPQEQDEAAFILHALEDRRFGMYEFEPDELEEIKLALEEAERGEFVPEEEMKAFFERCRRT